MQSILTYECTARAGSPGARVRWLCCASSHPCQWHTVAAKIGDCVEYILIPPSPAQPAARTGLVNRGPALAGTVGTVATGEGTRHGLRVGRRCRRPALGGSWPGSWVDEAGAGAGSEEGRRRVALASTCECVPALPHTFTLRLRRQSGRRAGGRGLMGEGPAPASVCSFLV